MMSRIWKPTRPSRWQTAARLLPNVNGAVAIEYGLLAALVVVAIVGSLRTLGISLVNLPLPSLIAAFEGALP